VNGSENPTPSVGMRVGWLVFGLLVVSLTVGGGLIVHDRMNTPVAGRATTPLTSRPTSAPFTAPALPPGLNQSEEPTPAPDGSINLTGVGSSRTVRCEDNAVSVSGVQNTVMLSGRCSRVDVSGMENTVVVEAADAIIVSGLNNKVTFLSGTPELSKTGVGNTVAPG